MSTTTADAGTSPDPTTTTTGPDAASASATAEEKQELELDGLLGGSASLGEDQHWPAMPAHKLHHIEALLDSLQLELPLAPSDALAAEAAAAKHQVRPSIAQLLEVLRTDLVERAQQDAAIKIQTFMLATLQQRAKRTRALWRMVAKLKAKVEDRAAAADKMAFEYKAHKQCTDAIMNNFPELSWEDKMLYAGLSYPWANTFMSGSTALWAVSKRSWGNKQKIQARWMTFDGMADPRHRYTLRPTLTNVNNTSDIRVQLQVCESFRTSFCGRSPYESITLKLPVQLSRITLKVFGGGSTEFFPAGADCAHIDSSCTPDKGTFHKGLAISGCANLEVIFISVKLDE